MVSDFGALSEHRPRQQRFRTSIICAHADPLRTSLSPCCSREANFPFMRDIFFCTFLDSALSLNKIGQPCRQTIAYPSIFKRVGVPRPQLYIDTKPNLYQKAEDLSSRATVNANLFALQDSVLQPMGQVPIEPFATDPIGHCQYYVYVIAFSGQTCGDALDCLHVLESFIDVHAFSLHIRLADTGGVDEPTLRPPFPLPLLIARLSTWKAIALVSLVDERIERWRGRRGVK